MSRSIKNLREAGFNTDHRTYVVAEIGINHGGDIEVAKRLIDSAAKAGADAVKFQTYIAEKRVSKRDTALYDILKSCELPFEAFKELKDYASQYKVDFFSTPFDEQSVDYLQSIGCDLYKVASFDVLNHKLLAKIAETGKAVIMSVGMASMNEIKEACDILRSRTSKIAILHCVSAYPTEQEDANLSAIYTLRDEFDCVIGQSDHTDDIVVPLYAVAAGAQILEKHYKIDRDMECVDAPVSITEEQMKRLISETRRLEKILGSGTVGLTESQKGTLEYRKKRERRIDKPNANRNRVVKKTPIGFYQLARKPGKEELMGYYSEKYYQTGSQYYQASYSEEELRYIDNKLFQKRIIAESFIKKKDKGTMQFLDVGAGEGWAMSHFNRYGYQVEGIDYSSFAISKYNDNLLDKFTEGDIFDSLNEMVLNRETFDVIMLDNVLEHVLEPLHLLRAIKEVLSDEGVVIVEVPNDFSGLQMHICEKGFADDEYWILEPEHVSYFNVDSLRSISESAGYKVKKIIGDYPIEFDLFSENTNYKKNPSVGNLSHKKRVMVEGFLHNISPEKTNRLYELMADMGLGRDITAFLRG